MCNKYGAVGGGQKHSESETSSDVSVRLASNIQLFAVSLKFFVCEYVLYFINLCKSLNKVTVHPRTGHQGPEVGIEV